MDGVHTAGRRTGTLLDNDGVVGAHLCALAAFNALLRIDLRFPVGPVQAHRILGADLHTGVCQTALAAVGHHDPFFCTRIAGKFDHIDQRRRIIRFRPVCRLDPIGYRGRVSRPAVGKSHGQAQPFSYDGSF